MRRLAVASKITGTPCWVNVDTSGDIPSILEILKKAMDDPRGKGALISAASDMASIEDLERCCGDELMQAPADIHVRAAVLCIAKLKHMLLKEDIESWSESDEDERWFRSASEDVYAHAQQAFRFLVGFLKVEDCSADWRDFRWEILNSYLACDWDRVVLLYNRAEDLKLKNLGEIAVLRGQFKFLFVFGRSIEQDVRRIVKTEEIRLTLESLCWEPKIYGLD